MKIKILWGLTYMFMGVVVVYNQIELSTPDIVGLFLVANGWLMLPHGS